MQYSNIKVEGVQLYVEWNYYKGCKGLRDSLGVPEEPDEEESAEVVDVYALTNKGHVAIITPLLSKEAFSEIEKKLLSSKGE
jgi:hypothetical protein